VIVHGGGPAINEALESANITPEFRDGIRVTDKETMKVVETVLSGKLNKSIVSDFQRYGLKAVGISGKDGLLIEAKKSSANIGYVGEITQINPKIIETLLANDFIPVISPVGTDKEGNTYNINADYAAVEIAKALKARKLVFLTDIDGIREDKDKPETLVSRANSKQILKLIAERKIDGGMIPKVKSCVEAIESGVSSVHIINGNVRHALLLEIYTKDGIGTIIEEDE